MDDWSFSQSSFDPSTTYRDMPFAISRGSTSARPSVFDDIATITSASHSRLLKAIQKRYLRAYDWGAWVAGAPRLEPVQPHKAAVVVMNAGEGVGLSLSLDFAEAGYTVFGLVHQDIKSSEDGSIGQLLYAWQKHRAEVLRQRAQHEPSTSRTMSPPLGNVFPLPFRPLSTSSRKKMRQTLLAYCSAQSLQLHAVILTPVFALPLDALDPKSDGSPPPPEDATFDDIELKLRYVSDTDLGSPGTESHGDSDSSEELVNLKALLPNPRKGIPNTAEGSYLPLSATNEPVIQRAAQREFTEQLVVAQMFADLLIPQSKRAIKDPAQTSRRTRTSVSVPALAASLRPPPFYLQPETPLGKYAATTDEEEDPFVRRVQQGIGSLVWTSIKRRLFHRVIQGVHPRRAEPPTPGTGGKIVCITGAGEASFWGGAGAGTAMSAARESMGKSLGDELKPLGVHVSVVRTGPLLARSMYLSSSSTNKGDHDSRKNVVSKADKTRELHFDRSMRRARFLAKMSALWAIDEHSCFWIVKQAVEARYPKRTYTFGFDVLVRKWANMLPDGMWQLASWMLYERMGGRLWEEILIREETDKPSRLWSLGSSLMSVPPASWASWALSKMAGRIRESTDGI